MTSASGRRPRVLAFLAWWALFAGLVLVGRISAVDDASVALVAPAAGAALLWLLTQGSRRASVLCLATMAGTRVVLMAATGAAWEVTLAVVVAALLQTWSCVVLVRRWCPGILGTGGTRSFHDSGVLVWGSLAVVLATGTGAVVGSGLVGVLGADVQGHVFVDWWARNLTGVILVGTTGHLAWEWVRDSRSEGRWVLVERARLPELAALVAVSGVTYGVIFFESALPLAFLPLTVSVWCATRFPTFFAVLHTTSFGALVLTATFLGRGSFGTLGGPQAQVLVTQAYLLTLLLTVLALAMGRDERNALMGRLRASQRETAGRAELLDAMTESMSEGLVVCDIDGVIVRTNTAARTLLASSATGYQETTQGYRVLRPDGTEISVEDHPSRRALREGVVPAYDLVLRRADGSERVLSVTASALTAGGSGGEAQGAMVVYRDVTDERGHSNRLTEFAEVVAHDLRGPLTVMHGWLDVALAGLGPGSDGAAVTVGTAPGATPLVRRAMERALVSTTRMEDLISDLLIQATAASGLMEPVRCELDGEDGLVAEVAGEAGASESVRVGPIPAVLVDVDMVRQLVSNLVGNALKYVADDTVPLVVLTGVRSGDRVLIEMTDNGIGVPALQREAIFDRFHRAHAQDTSYVGTGLGLAICRTIVERHGGEIVCRSATTGRPGAIGTTFAFDLPAA